MAQPEFWLRGPIAGVDLALMPAAHALLQTVEDVENAVRDLPHDLFWRSPSGAPSIGFHVMHLSGSTDRLLTYARGPIAGVDLAAATLLEALHRTFDAALAQIRATAPSSLGDARAVGRAGLPTTVLGLIFHAAEHSQRHAGQVVTTAKIVRGTLRAPTDRARL
jgi:hypothetical protein